MLVDEQVWRAQFPTLQARRVSLCTIFNSDMYSDAPDCGIGGGYGQFGILTEKEFNILIKADGKRIRKFTEHPDQFKAVFGDHHNYPAASGNHVVDAQSSSGGKDPTDDLDFNVRKHNAFESNQQDIVEIAKRRFNYEEEESKDEKAEEIIGEEDLFGNRK